MASGGVATLTIAAVNIAEAGIVASTTAPIPPSTHGFTGWDVDGDGTDDFRVGNFNSTGAVLIEFGGGQVVVSAGLTTFTDGLQKLSAGVTVGSAMTGLKFFSNPQGRIAITWLGSVASSIAFQGWSTGATGFFGFKFTSGANTHYGWAEISIHGQPMGQGYTITRAYYDNTPGASIIVGDTGSAVPEPSTCALALLAAGGVAAYKGRRKQAAV